MVLGEPLAAHPPAVPATEQGHEPCLHIAAVTQLRHSHSPGRAFYDRKLGEGHTPKAAIRALTRRLSNVVYRHLIADAARRH
jgi:transposase